MNPLNDGHILSAQYLNIIGDVILLKHQKSFGVKGGEREKRFVDFYNNKHRIYEFDVVDKFESFVVNYKTNQIFFDIDLDYFVKKVGDYMDGDGYEIMSEQEIAEIVNPSRPLFKKIYQCIEGFTVATEQKHCGGLINSFKILSIIENQLFSSGKKWK